MPQPSDNSDNGRLSSPALWVGVCLAAGLLALSSAPTSAQNLQDSGLDLPGVWASEAAWGDYDGDGDADLILIGETLEADGTCLRIARVLRNDGGHLVEDVTQTGRLKGVYFGDVGWADYDSDGDLDLALAGWDEDGAESLSLYLNEPGADAGSRQFTLDLDQRDDFGGDILVGMRYADLAWGDVDRDGDLDLIVSGMDANGSSATKLYTNDRGRFRLDELNSEVLLNVHNGELAWADYDNDGDLDLALAGENVQGSILRVTEFYRNKPTGTLTLDSELTSQTKLSGGSLAWGDYDGDGNLDLAQSGRTGGWSTVLQLYLNRPAGTLTVDPTFALNAFLRVDGDLDWVDYDNDGDLDLATSGRTILSDRHAFVFRNDDGIVSAVSAEPGVEGLAGGASLWGDYDGDGRVDLLLTGIDADGLRQTRLYANSVAGANQPPSPPASLNQPIVTSQRTLFTWPSAVDLESPVLSYNVRVGSEPGGGDILSAQVPLQPGNAGLKTSHSLERPLLPDTYYWSVQAVDGGLLRSDFATEGEFVVRRFVSSDQNLRGMQYSAMSWGDVEGDGDVDLALLGTNRSGDAIVLFYVNRDGVLTPDADSDLTPLSQGDLAWGDYDGDGDLDLFTSGQIAQDNRRGILYQVTVRGDDSILFEFAHRLQPDLDASSVAWGDIDLDGDLDLVYGGLSADVVDGRQQSYTRIWTNVGDGGFEPGDDSLTGLNNGDLALGDIDGDGDLDLIVTGKSSEGERRTDVYFNELQDGMVDAGVDLPGLESSTLALGDYDRDGDLDLVLGGLSQDLTLVTGLYDNDGLGAYQQNADVRLPGIQGGDLTWADYDNDQDLDLILAGNTGSTSVLQIWENTIGQAAPDSAFALQSLPELVGVDRAAVAMADADGDGDLDLISSGRAAGAPATVVNDNLTAASNFGPDTPPDLSEQAVGEAVTLEWNRAADDGDPPPQSLTYNVRVGSSPGAHDVVSGRIPLGPGNAGHSLDLNVGGLTSGTYFWSVQTIDAGFTGSSFATDQSFIIDTVPPEVSRSSFVLNRTQVGLGQTVSLALEIADVHSGVDPAVAPTVTADFGGEILEFSALQFTGDTWSGELTVSEGTPSGDATISVRGAIDGKGNVLTPFDSVGAFTVDSIRPSIENRSPTDQQDDVAAGSAATIVIEFSEPLDEATVVDANFSLRLASILVPVSAVYDSTSQEVTVTPEGGLAPGSGYTVEVSAAVTDLAGNRAQDADSWTFRTRIPQLLSTTPAANSTQVLVDDGRMEAVFDAAILRLVLEATTAVEVLREGQSLALREAPLFDEESGVLRFEPAEGLRPGSRYEVILSGLLGGPLRAVSDGGDYRWKFATGVPQVVTLTPADQDTTVSVSSAGIAATFDGRLDAQALAEEGAVDLRREGQVVVLREAPLFDGDSGTLRFEPAEGLRPGSRYEVTLSALLGGPLRAASDSGAYSWQFATSVPQVVALSPADQDTTVDLGAGGIVVTFDGFLDPQALAEEGAVVVRREGQILELREAPLFDEDSGTLRFEPAEGLRPGSRYGVTLSALLGGPRRAASDSGAYSWQFATSVPQVVALSPADQDTTVDLSAGGIVVTFDGFLDEQALIEEGAVDLRREGQVVELREAPLFDGDSGTLRFEPAEGLRPGSRYEVTLSALLGGPRRAVSDSSAYNWQFATSVPQVVALTPADQDTTVSVSADGIVVTFDGPLDEQALAAEGAVQLFAEGVEIPLTSPVYDDGPNTLSMMPTAGLRPGTSYRVQITSDVRGPRADDGVIWTFATEVPRVTATDPADGASISAGSRRIQVQFSSAVDESGVHPRNFRLSQGGRPLMLAVGEFLYDAETFTVSLPTVELVSGSGYRLVVSARIGGPGARGPDLDILFTTDIPSVVSTLPDDGAEGVSTGQSTLQTTFSGPIARRDDGGFILRARSLSDVLTSDGETTFQIVPITGFGTDSSLTVVNFAPEGGLVDFTEYEVAIAPRVFGSLSDETFTWRFSTAARLADAAAGGTLTNPDGAVELYLPPNALASSAAEIRIAPVAETAGKPAALLQSGVQIGRAFQIDAGNAVLRKPATLTLRYTEAELGAANPARLGIFTLQGLTWNRIGGTASPARAVRTTVTEFGVFALFEDLAAGFGSVGLSAIDCQPQAFAPAGGNLRDTTDISFELSGPADVTVRVYNAAGRLERVVVRDQPMAPGRNSLPWDGRDEDRKTVASGLYVVVVSAGDAQAEKVVAVVR